MKTCNFFKTDRLVDSLGYLDRLVVFRRDCVLPSSGLERMSFSQKTEPSNNLDFAHEATTSTG